MASLNQCNFIGRIGKIESRYLQNGDAVTNFSLACNEYYKDKNGEKVEKVEWVNCVAYRKTAETMEKYCTKGMQVYIGGKLETKKYTDKNGIEKVSTQIVVNDLKMLGKSESQPKQSKPQEKPKGTGFEDMDDDIPF